MSNKHTMYTTNRAIYNLEQRHQAERNVLTLGAGYLADVGEGFVRCINPAIVRVGEDGKPHIIKATPESTLDECPVWAITIPEWPLEKS